MDNVDARNSAGSREIERHLAAVWWRFSRQSDETSFWCPFMLHALTYEPAILLHWPGIQMWHLKMQSGIKTRLHFFGAQLDQHCSSIINSRIILRCYHWAHRLCMWQWQPNDGNDDTVDDNDEKDGDDNQSTLGAVHFQGHRVSCARGRRGLHRGECGLHTR